MDNDKIKRFYQGKADIDEVKQILEWIYSEKFENEVGIHLQDLLHSYRDQTQFDKSLQLKLIKEKIDFQKIPSQESYYDVRQYAKTYKKSSFWGYSTRLAAVILLMVISVWALFLFENSRIDTTIDKSVVNLTKSTSKGQKSTIILQDGSRVMLNSNSSITYPEVFPDDIRTVELTGEAFFEVKSDPDHPFVVVAKNITTTALGTSFNINASDIGGITVSLIQGKVVVKDQKTGDEGKVLSPGEEIYFDENNDHFLRVCNIDAVTSWRDGVLYFSNASFDEVMVRLEMWYGVDFEISNRPYELKHYTGKFINESLDNVLEGISFTNNFSYKINGKKVEIKFIDM